MVKRTRAKGRGGKAKPRTRPYPYEFRLKMVRLYLEEGYSTSVLREHFGVSHHSVTRWAKAYREQGPDGLLAKPRPGAKCTNWFHRLKDRDLRPVPCAFSRV